MATAIGNLVLKVGSDVGGLRKGLRGAGADVSRFTGGAMASLMKFAGMLGGVLGVKREFAAMDTLAKMSDRLGVASEKLAGLRHAAELTGAGADMLDAGLGTLAKRLGEAARGSGAAVPALDELGLSAQRLVQMKLDDAFGLIADRLKTIEEPMRRNAIVSNLFSKANQGLLNTLTLGSAGLAEMQKAAERLGLAINEQTLEEIAKANDAITVMGAVVTGIMRRIAVAVAPVVVWFANLGTTIASNARMLLKLAGSFLAYKAAVAAVNVVMRTAAALHKAYTAALIFSQAVTVAGVVRVVAGVTAAVAAFVVMDQALAGVEAKASKAVKQTERLPPSLQAIADQETSLVGVAAAMGDVASSAEGINRAVLSKAQELESYFGERLPSQVDRTMRAMAEFSRLGGPDISERMKDLQNRLQSLSEQRQSLKAIVDLFGNFGEAARFASDELQKIRPAQEVLDALKAKLDALTNAGIIQATEAQAIFNKALADSPLNESVRQLQALQQEALYLSAGLTDAQRALQEFGQIEGVTRFQIMQFGQLQEKIEGLQKSAGMKAEGEALTKQLMTPIERARQEAERIQELFRGGFITEDVAMCGMREQINRVQDQTGGGDGQQRFAGVQLAGSAEAARTIMANVQGGAGTIKGDKTWEKRTAKGMAEAVDILSQLLTAQENQEVVDMP